MSNIFRQNVAFLTAREPVYTSYEIMLAGRIDPATGTFDPNTMNGLPTGYMWVTGVGSRSAVRAVMSFVMRQVALAAEKRVLTGINTSGERVAIEPVADGQSAPIADQLQQESKKAITTPFSMVTSGRVQYPASGGLTVYVGDYAPLGWQGGYLAIDSGDVPASANEHSWLVVYFTGVYGEAPTYVVTTPITSATNAGLLLSSAFAEVLPNGAIRLAAISISNGQTTITPATSRLEDLRDPLSGGGVASVVAGTNVTVDNTDPANPIVSASGGGGGTGDYILIREEQAQNTAGGTFTSGAQRTRVLTTEVVDTGGFASLASNQITLAAGTYRIRARCPARLVNQHQARLQNVTDATTTLLGTSEYSPSAVDTPNNCSEIIGRFTIAGTKTFEIQHICTTTRATDGFGAASNFAQEIYTVVELIRE